MEGLSHFQTKIRHKKSNNVSWKFQLLTSKALFEFILNCNA